MSLRSNAHDVEINSHARHTQSTHKKQLETRKTRRTTMTAMKFSFFFGASFFLSSLGSRFDAIYFLKAVRTWWIIRCNEFLFNGTITAAAILLLTNTMIKLSGSAPVGVSSRPSAFSRTEPDLTIFFLLSNIFAISLMCSFLHTIHPMRRRPVFWYAMPKRTT